MEDDKTLLDHYTRQRSQAAFAELVSRHVDMVYAAAMRETHDAHQAQDATQATFLLLARRRPTDRSVAGWLFLTARNLGRDIAKHERRLRARERRAAMRRPEAPPDPSETGEPLLPVLNEAVAKLSAADRHVVVLRFFQSRSFAEIAVAMNTSENAAKMRVSRAVDKLRKKFAALGVVSPEALPAALASTAAPAPAAVAVAVMGPASTGARFLVENAMRRVLALKLAGSLAVVVICAATVVSVMAQADGKRPTPAPPATPVKAPQAAGTWAVARFDAIVDAQAAATLQQGAAAVATGAKQYQCFTLPSDTLTQRLGAMLDSPGLRLLNPRVGWFDDGERRGPRFAGGEFGLLIVGGKAFSLARNGTSDLLFERTRENDTRFTLDCQVILFGQFINLNDKIHYQAPAKANETFFAIAPAMKDGNTQLFHVVVWQISGPESTAERTTSTAAWIGQTAAPSPTNVFQPIKAAFEDTAVRGTLLSAQLPDGNDPNRAQGNGLQKYRFVVGLQGLQMKPGEMSGMFTDWEPANAISSVANFDMRRRECVVDAYLPWHRRTATLRLGVPAGGWQLVATLTPADVGKATEIASPGRNATVTFDGIDPNKDAPGCTIKATSRNVGRRTNVAIEAFGPNGEPLRPTSLQWGGGDDAAERQWTTTLPVPVDQVKEIRLVTQPLAWATFADIALPAVDPEPTAAKAPVGVQDPATRPAFTPDTPEAAQEAIRTAVQAGDLAAVMELTYVTSGPQREMAEVMTRHAIASADLFNAAAAAFGRADAERARLGTPSTPSPVRFKVDGDVATVEKTDNVQYAGPEPRMRKVAGKWKADLSTLDAGAAGNRVKAAEAEIKRLRQLAADIRAAKFDTARDAAEALSRRP